MELSDDYLSALLESLAKDKDIKPGHIPDIDLYMDQVTTFIDSRLGHLKRDPKDSILTKTMINNYTKSKILPPSKNKKYDKRHMLLLILIYYMKQVLSISDIQTLFIPLFKELQASDDGQATLEVLYDLFLDIKKDDFLDIERQLSEKVKHIEEKTSILEVSDKKFCNMLLTVLMLVMQADIQKRLAEKIIDDYFK